jgi:hypothetical protein
MRKSWRGVWTAVAVLLCACATCGCGIVDWLVDGRGVSLYGPPAVPLEVKSFTFAPLGPIHTGETLTFTAEIEPVEHLSAFVYAEPGQPGSVHFDLRDDGVPPDQTAGDNVFTGAGQWLTEYGTGKFTLHLVAGGEKNGQQALGEAERILKVRP